MGKLEMNEAEVDYPAIRDIFKERNQITELTGKKKWFYMFCPGSVIYENVLWKKAAQKEQLPKLTREDWAVAITAETTRLAVYCAGALKLYETGKGLVGLIN